MSCGSSIFAGMDRADLQSQLTALQGAYLELAGGSKVASASYAQGNGSKSVSFTQTSLGTLAVTIRQLQQELGITSTARRAIGAKF